MAYASTRDAVLGDWVLIAYDYMLHVGEYSRKGSWNESKQTVEFRMMDVTFFELDTKKRLRQMPRDASDEQILRAAGATLRLLNQKNGWKNVCIFHHANGDDITYPTRALGRRYSHIRQHTTDTSISMSTYFVEGCKRHLKDTDVSAGVKMAAAERDYPFQSIPIDRVDTHSLRTGGANSLSLNGYSDTEIQKWAAGAATYLKNALLKAYCSPVLAYLEP